MKADWFDIKSKLGVIFVELARTLEEFDDTFDPEVRVADVRFGDFQVNGVLGYAKRHKKNPRELAQKLLEVARQEPELFQFEIELSGPGFLNIRLSREFLQDWIHHFQNDLEGSNKLEGKTIVIDYSSPNTAKEMHVGHLRSMIIGESIQRVLSYQGADIIRDNHIGDWGTQFGILIMAVKNDHLDVDALPEDKALESFENMYKKGSALAKDRPEFLDEARRELVKLQHGDAENLKIWEAINRASYKAFDKIYEQMDVVFDHILGESFYRDKVNAVCNELQNLGIAEEDQGALVVFHRDHERFKDQPFLIRKSDGASNYATTDLATALYRVNEWMADEIIYVTDGRQQDHFQQLFLTVKRWFSQIGKKVPELRHVWFGTVLGEDGRAIKTRSGESIKLKSLIDEGISRAYKIVAEKSPDLSEEEKLEVARVVGIGAIKYADLSQNRTSDYIFSWDKMLSFDGNTAPYLLYAIARIYAILRKVENRRMTHIDEFSTPEELSLARKLIEFPGVINQVIDDLRPHFLCTYLFELASHFSAFYNTNRIVGEPESILNKRLLLCNMTLRILEQGLNLLGIETLEKM